MSDDDTTKNANTARRRAALESEILFGDRATRTREDTIVGEIVRILVNADKAAFAKIYAVAKAEDAAMQERSRSRLREIYREHDEREAAAREPEAPPTEATGS